MPLPSDLIPNALQAFRQTSGLTAVYSPAELGPDRTTDGWVDLRVHGKHLRFIAWAKSTLQASHLAGLRERATTPSTLLFTRHVSQPLAQQLQAAGLQFVDTAGNAYIDHEGVFILITGNAAPTHSRRRPSLSPSTWKVAYALLRLPETATCTVRELATHAGTSHGAAHTAVKALQQRGWVQDLGRRGQEVTKPTVLWNAWEMGYGDRLGNKLFVTSAAHPAHPSLQAWKSAVEIRFGDDALLGGELGAQSMGAELVGATAVVHVRQWDAATMGRLRLVPDPKGPVIVRHLFGDANHDPAQGHLADAMLVRAELMAINDERLDDTRAFLKRRISRGLPSDS